MGRWFKDKKSAGCAMCKPWKHGHSIKFKEKELALRKRTDKRIHEIAVTGGVTPLKWCEFHFGFLNDDYGWDYEEYEEED